MQFLLRNFDVFMQKSLIINNLALNISEHALSPPPATRAAQMAESYNPRSQG